MKKALEKYAKRLQKDAEVAFIRRMMWIDMEARIREMFREIESSPQARWYHALVGGCRVADQSWTATSGLSKGFVL